MDSGRLEESEKHLRALEKLDPDGMRVHYGLGLLAYSREDFKTARTHLTKLTECPSARRRAFTLLATLTDGNSEASRKFNERADQLPVDEAWPDPFEMEMIQQKLKRARPIAQFLHLKNLGRRKEANRLLQQHASEAPNEEACFLLAVSYYEGEEYEPAEPMFREALRFKPNNVQAHVFLGVTLFMEAERLSQSSDGKEKAIALYREAVTEEEKALVLEQDLGRAHLLRGQALQRLGRIDDALQAMRRAVITEPNVPDTHLILGEALAEAGQLPEALEHLQDALRLAKPNDSRPREALKKWQAKEPGKKEER
jgi:tetratricopeptide (TPR) repeat protein